MNSNEFKEGVYNKYYKQKEIKNDDFFNNYQYKDKKINPIKIAANFVLVILTSIAICIGGLSVYATFGGKISGKPVFEWFKVSFSDEYENYRNEVHGETIQGPNESSIDLVSTVCDEGFVILEFDVKLSAEDKEYLKIGNSVLTEEYLKATDDEDSRTLEEDYDKETHQFSVQTTKELIKKMLGDKIIEDKICVGCNLQPGTFKDSKIIQKKYNKNVIIDGEYIYVQLSPQSVKKISDMNTNYIKCIS